MPVTGLNLRARKPSLRAVIASGLGLFCGVAALFLPPVYQAIGPDVVLQIYNAAAIGVALTVVILAGLMWARSERGEVLRRVSGSLGVGLTLWMVGEIYWQYHLLVLNQDLPRPSLADACWLAGYVPLITGLVLRYHTFRLRLTARRWLILVSLCAALVTLALAVVVRPILDHRDPAQPAMTILSLLYVVGDLVIVFVALLIVQSLAQGAMFAPWSVVAVGCLMVAVSDLMLAYGTWSGAFAGDTARGVSPVLFAFYMTYFASFIAAAVGAYWLARLHRIL